MATNLKILLLITFAFLVEGSNVFGQNVYQKRSDLNYWYDQFVSVFPSDTGFFTLGQSISSIALDSTNHYPERRLIMTWYDWQGTIVKQKNYVKDKTDYYAMWNDNNTIYNNGYYHFGTVIDSMTLIEPNTADIFVAKFNYEGDTIWTRRFDFGNYDGGRTGIITNNGDFIGIGFYRESSGKLFTRAMRFDSLGNVIWNKTYNNYYGNTSNYILKDHQGNFYIAGQANINNGGGSNPKNLRAMLLKIDSTGTQVWMKYIPGICNDCAGGISFAADGNLLMANRKCYYQPAGNAVDSRFSLYKLNKITGDTLWHKGYPVQYINTDQPYFVETLNDGGVIMGGVGDQLFIQDEDTLFGKNTGVVIKTDSLGSMKWQRYYFYNISDAQNMGSSYITDGKQAPDGGFILVGRTTRASDFDDGWIIKTDENGCIDASCVNGVEELEEDDYRLFIYPNPAQDYVSVDLPITYNKATLQIYTMQGQLVKSTAINGGGLQRIDTSELPNGIYQLLVSSNTQLIGRQKLVVTH